MNPNTDYEDDIDSEPGLQTTRRNARRTERLHDTDASNDPLRENWRRDRSRSAGRTRPNQKIPSTWQEAAIWLQQGGWRIVAGAVTVLFVVILLLVLNQRSRTLPDNTTADSSIPTAGIAGGIVLPTQASDSAIGLPPTTDAPAAIPTDGAQFQVFGTESQGLFLRADSSADSTVLTTMPEGTIVTVIGEDAPGPSYTWKHVRAADGTEGWAASDFLQPVQ